MVYWLCVHMMLLDARNLASKYLPLIASLRRDCLFDFFFPGERRKSDLAISLLQRQPRAMFALQLTFSGCANSGDICQAYCPELLVSSWHLFPMQVHWWWQWQTSLCIKKPAMTVPRGKG